MPELLRCRQWVFTIVAVACTSCGSTAQTPAAPATTDPATTTEPTTTSTGPSSAAVTTGPSSAAEKTDLFPDVIDAAASQASDGTWTISATLSSPYDSPDRYADAWRVVGPEGTVFGERILTHDHASEQPFTRNLSGISIPSGITVVTIQGRDLHSGWGGSTYELTLGTP